MEIGNRKIEEVLDVTNILRDHFELRSLIELMLTKQDRKRLDKLVKLRILEDTACPTASFANQISGLDIQKIDK